MADESKEKQSNGNQKGETPELPEDLIKSSMVVENAIEYLQKEGVSNVSIASSCLGAVLSILARDMDREPIIDILETAIENVKSGAVHASLTQEDKNKSS